MVCHKLGNILTGSIESKTCKDAHVPAGLKGRGQAAAVAASASDDRLYAYEAAGQLLGMEDLPAEEQQEGVAALLRPLLAQMQAQLAVAGKAPAGARNLFSYLPPYSLGVVTVRRGSGSARVVLYLRSHPLT